MIKPEPVVFRKWTNGDVIALFPEIPADNAGSLCRSYEHIGQYGAANYRLVMNDTERASSEEYANLFAELLQMGYRLRPIQYAQGGSRRRRRERHPASTPTYVTATTRGSPMQIQGRGQFVGKLTYQDNGLHIRIDDQKNDEFWLEITIPIRDITEVLVCNLADQFRLAAAKQQDGYGNLESAGKKRSS